MNVSRVAADVKERLVREAEEREASVNDLMVSILAEKFHVRFAGTGRKSPGSKTTEGAMCLRVPPTLKRKVDLAVARQDRGQRSIVALVDAVLRERYDLSESLVA